MLVALVGLERLAELVVSTRNAAWSFAHGGPWGGGLDVFASARSPTLCVAR